MLAFRIRFLFVFTLNYAFFFSQHDVFNTCGCYATNILLFGCVFFSPIFLCRFQHILYPKLLFFRSPVQYLNSQQHNAVHSICFLSFFLLFLFFWLFDLDNCFDPIICILYIYSRVFFSVFHVFFFLNRMATLQWLWWLWVNLLLAVYFYFFFISFNK